MFDFVRAAPGLSPTSPTSPTSGTAATTVSAFGSGTNENQFLFDGMNNTCPCNGVARAEPGVDFIQEVRVQSIGASAEFGNVQGAVINVITKQGSARFLFDASYYAQTASLTSQPVVMPLPAPSTDRTGYERVRYRDLTGSVGGPVVRERLWFFGGYQYLRDYDSQPGTDPALPRIYEQNKSFAKLTWRLAPSLQLVQSLHHEYWVNPVRPTRVTPLEATARTHASVPAITFGHLSHTLSPNTVWEVRVGRFVYSQEGEPSTGDTTTPSRFDRLTGVTSDAPSQFGNLTIRRTSVKALINHYRPGFLGADHQWKAGVQIEQDNHDAQSLTPTGVRFIDSGGEPFQAVWRDPFLEGGAFVTAAAFATDAITIGDRLTINAGVRVDHHRAISQDLTALDSQNRELDAVVQGLGTMYTWNIVSPRLGLTGKLTGDGRTMFRASYGRFSQGVLTGELAPFHPGVSTIRTNSYDPITGDYTRPVSIVDPRINLLFDRATRAPRTDEYSVGIDREVGRRVALAFVYVHKDGANFIGWTDVGGQYREETRVLPDGRSLPVFVLVNGRNAPRYLLTNPDDYSLRYNGLAMVVEKRRSNGWQAFGSYTFSRVSGLQASSGAAAAAPQASTVAPPQPITFGRDPNDLTNARGLMPNDRPHIFRLMSSVDIPHTGLQVAANWQWFSGKPWAATAQIVLPQGDQRVLLEPRGARRLSSQSILDLRLARPIRVGAVRIDVLVDVLNLLDDGAEEALATDNLFSASFGQPTVFVDPRRAMLGVRFNLPR
jgi:hypothetical protein